MQSVGGGEWRWIGGGSGGGGGGGGGGKFEGLKRDGNGGNLRHVTSRRALACVFRRFVWL